MRILLVHNAYRQRGGEDRVFETEARLLTERGHQVSTYVRQNPAPGDMAAVRVAAQAFWNQGVYRDLRRLIRETSADVVHLHNTFPIISAAACYAARREGAATVQTLHNYRLLCPNGLFFRGGKPCEDCTKESVPVSAVIHACYRNSYMASAVAAGTVALHRASGTWTNQINRYIALTEFARQKFIEGGLPSDRIVVKPNFVHPDAGPGTGRGHFALFVGRLSPEKGVDTLLAAWHRVGPQIPLIIIGDGPLASVVRRAVAENPNVRWLGHRSADEVRDYMGVATCLIVPSVWYETFGLVIAEAFARGTPVLAAGLGAVAEIVDSGRTGLHFTPGDVTDLVRQLNWMLEHQSELNDMRHAARAEYERRYSADTNYAMLRRIYEDAIAAGAGATS